MPSWQIPTSYDSLSAFSSPDLKIAAIEAILSVSDAMGSHEFVSALPCKYELSINFSMYLNYPSCTVAIHCRKPPFEHLGLRPVSWKAQERILNNICYNGEKPEYSVLVCGGDSQAECPHKGGPDRRNMHQPEAHWSVCPQTIAWSACAPHWCTAAPAARPWSLAGTGLLGHRCLSHCQAIPAIPKMHWMDGLVSISLHTVPLSEVNILYDYEHHWPAIPVFRKIKSQA